MAMTSCGPSTLNSLHEVIEAGRFSNDKPLLLARFLSHLRELNQQEYRNC